MKYPILLLFCAAYLGLAGLDHCLFWDDEAIVAIHSKNFLATGNWTAWSGPACPTRPR